MIAPDSRKSATIPFSACRCGVEEVLVYANSKNGVSIKCSECGRWRGLSMIREHRPLVGLPLIWKKELKKGLAGVERYVSQGHPRTDQLAVKFTARDGARLLFYLDSTAEKPHYKVQRKGGAA